MARRFIIAGSTGNTFDVFIQDATATNGSGLINVTTAINAAYRAGNLGKFTTFALSALSSADVAWASGGFFQHSSTSVAGMYRLDVPDAAFATTPSATIFLSSGSGGANMAPVVFDVHIVSSSATAGDLNVNVGKINNISATSVSAVKNSIGLDTIPTNFGSLAVSSSGEVNIKTNNDKSGYALTQTFPSNFSSLSITSSGEVKDRQAFPTNFASLAISTSGEVNIKTNNDKTGYSLSQSFPTNFSSLAISSSGEVTVKTNNDKTGYSLSQSFPSNFSSLAISTSGEVTVKTNNDKTGYALTAGERNSVSDAFLDRDMSVGVDSGSSAFRTPRQALRILRNKVSVPLGTVYKEDDSTASWTFAVTTDATASPITVIDPA